MVDRTANADQISKVLIERLPQLTADLIAAVTQSVPEYRRLFDSTHGEDVRGHIAIALRTFIRINLIETRPSEALEQLLRPALETAAALGRGEAQSGRGTEELLNAFRVGGRSLWSGIASEATRLALSGQQVAALAGSLFDYIDRVSAATVTAHHVELSRLQWSRDLARDAVVRGLLTHGRVTESQCLAARWNAPRRIALVVVDSADLQDVARRIPPNAIIASGGLPHAEATDGVAVCVIPQDRPQDRGALLSALAGTRVVVGPDTPTDETPRAFQWTMALWRGQTADLKAIDAVQHLPEILLHSDPQLVAQMRVRVLQPLDAVAPQSRRALEATLESWIRHRGRQDRVAAELFVHPQTVRYRLGRLQELLGDYFDDPSNTLELLMALSAPTSESASTEN